MTEAQPSRAKRSTRLLLALPLLVVLAVAVNWSSLVMVAQGKRSLRSVLYGRMEGHPSGDTGWKMPKDTGSAEARVLIEVFCIAGDPCHIGTAYLGRGLGVLDPKRIRVKFSSSMPGAPGSERQQKLKLGCDQGLAINGKTQFKVPDPANPAKPKVVMMSHSGGGMDGANLFVVLDQALKQAYKGKGLGMTAAEFQARLDEIQKQHRAADDAAAKARQEAEKSKAN